MPISPSRKIVEKGLWADMIGIQDNYEYCSTIAHLLTGRRSGIPQTTKRWMHDTLDSLKKSDNIYDYKISSTGAASPHKWLFHIIVQPNLGIDYYHIFIRLTQDNECSYLVRHWEWGTGIHRYDADLQEFIHPGRWRKDFGQI